MSLPSPDFDEIQPGVLSAGGGHASYVYIERAVRMALAGEIQVITTAPISKAALHAAGHKYDGHTGLIQHLTNADASYMLLASEKISAIHVTTHVSLADAVKGNNTARILATTEIVNDHLKKMGIAKPRIAMAGLNPHSGEEGIFGRQEIENITPAVEAAKAKGINVTGPYAGDTVFFRAMRGEFDVVVAQYHDQGHIPIKLVAFEDAVNVSLGMPIARTSVDHGTAFDIAWQAKADHGNMLKALAYADTLAQGLNDTDA